MNENLPRSGDVSSGGTASNVRDTVREKASTIAHGAKEQAREQFDSRKGKAIGELDGLANALRRAGGELESSNGMSGRLLSTVADRIESFGRSIDGRDLDDIVHEVEGFARRNPAAFLGGAVAIGFLASRFLKSSSGHTRGLYGSESYAHHETRYDSAVGTGGFQTGADHATDFTTPGSSTSGLYGAGATSSGARTGSSAAGSTGASGTAGAASGDGASDIERSIGTTRGTDLGGSKRQR